MGVCVCDVNNEDGHPLKAGGSRGGPAAAEAGRRRPAAASPAGGGGRSPAARAGATGHRPPGWPAGAGEAPQAGRLGGRGARGVRGAGRRAAPSRRGAGGWQGALRARRPAGGRQRSVSTSLPFAHSPPAPAALTQSATAAATRFARDAAGLPPTITPPTHPPPPPRVPAPLSAASAPLRPRSGPGRRHGRERPGCAGRLRQRERRGASSPAQTHTLTRLVTFSIGEGGGAGGCAVRFWEGAVPQAPHRQARTGGARAALLQAPGSGPGSLPAAGGRKPRLGRPKGSPAPSWGCLGEAGVEQRSLGRGRERFYRSRPRFWCGWDGLTAPSRPGRAHPWSPWKGKGVVAWAELGLRGCSWAGVGWGGFECCFRNMKKDGFSHTFAHVPACSPARLDLLSLERIDDHAVLCRPQFLGG